MEEARKITKKNMEIKEKDIEEEITSAMRARVGHFKEQADLLTLEGVRRVLEKDLGLKTHSLDVHKRFIKQCLQECFDSANEEKSVSKNSAESVEETVRLNKGPGSPESLQIEKEVKESSSDNEVKLQESSVLGLLEGDESVQQEIEKTQDLKEDPSEDSIKNVIQKRADYFRANSEELNMVAVRRLLEQDLKLDKNALDPYKKFISEQLDQVLCSPKASKVVKPANGFKKTIAKRESYKKASKEVSSNGSSDSSESSDEGVDEDEVKPKKRAVLKGGKQKAQELKNRKRPAEEAKTSGNKRKKPVEPLSEESADANDEGNLSENGSQSSAEKPVQTKREISAPVYGKRVEHLKSIIKSCGMSVPPSVYKRAKQAPENKHEEYLLKELEDILGKEGLSTNPSEKDIKAVKKKKERTKELEGIDLSNIVSSSRRRSTTNFIAPPKPKVPVESDEEEEDTDDEDGDDGDDDSNSEESNEEVEDESD